MRLANGGELLFARWMSVDVRDSMSETQSKKLNVRDPMSDTQCHRLNATVGFTHLVAHLSYTLHVGVQ